MRLLELLLAGAGGFVLLHFLLIPLVETRAETGSAGQAAGRAALSSVLGFLKSLAAIVVGTCGLLLVFMGWAQLGGGTTETELAAALERARSAREGLSSVRAGWSLFFMAALIVALAILAYRNGKRLAVERLRAAYQAAFERLTRERDAGRLEDLPATADMDAAAAQLQSLKDMLAREADPARCRVIGEAIHNAQQAYLILDLERRMEIRIGVEAPASAGGWRTRVQVFFTSKGWFASVKGVSKGFAYAGLALLLLSLVAFHSSTVRAELDDRIVQIEELQLKLRRDELYSDYADLYQASASPAARGELEEDDEEAISTLARLFEDGLLDSPDFAPDTTASPRAVASIGRLAARNSILRAAQQVSAPEANLVVNESMSRAPGLNESQRRGLSILEDGAGTRGPRTRAGRRFAEVVRSEIARRGDASWSNLKAKASTYAASYREPVAMRDVGRMMVGEVFGTAADGVVPLPDEVVGQMADKVVKKAGGGAIESYFDIKTRELLIELARSPDADAALKSFRSLGSSPVPPSSLEALADLRATTPNQEAILTILRDNPPTVSRLAEAHLDPNQAARAVRSTRDVFRPSSGALRADLLTDSLLSYSDLAPPRIDADLSTELGKALTENDPAWFEGGGGGGGGGGSSSRSKGASKAKARSRTSFSRGRSFGRMRGFSRVGGVVLGREPEGNSGALDFVDLAWTRAGSSISLELTRADGSKHALGPYRADIVHRALVYAADGRPLTVTMTSAPPLPDLKIHLHPALIDTALGCKAIEIDRFVDKYVPSDVGDPRYEATMRVHRDVAFYELAWACRGLAIFSKLDEERSVATSVLVNGVLDVVADQFAEFGVVVDRDFLVLDGLRDSLESEVSLLRRKSEFFDADLVSVLRRASRGTGDLDQLAESLYSSFRSDVGELDYSSLSRVERWMLPPPEFQVWSGVRESAYSLDADLEFLRAPAGEGLWPLDFMIQVAFTTAPSFLDSGVDPDGYYDMQPWEFDQLQAEIATRVQEGLADPATRDVFDDMGEFTVLQRLFRNALDGRLGDSFPLDALVALTHRTGDPEAKPVRTLRWNARPGQLEFEVQMRLALVAATLDGLESSDPLVRKIASFVEELEADLSKIGDLEAIDTSTWDVLFDTSELLLALALECGEESLQPSPACELLPVLQSLSLSARARTLRHSLGLQVDDAQIVLGAQCPPID